MIHDALSRMTQEMITLDTEVLLTLSVGFLCKSLFHGYLFIRSLDGVMNFVRAHVLSDMPSVFTLSFVISVFNCSVSSKLKSDVIRTLITMKSTLCLHFHS